MFLGINVLWGARTFLSVSADVLVQRDLEFWLIFLVGTLDDRVKNMHTLSVGFFKA